MPIGIPLQQERRRHPRFVVRTPVRLLMAGKTDAMEGRLVDLSAGGCSLIVSLPVKMGGSVSLTFVALGKACSAVGTIVRRGGDRGLVIRFERLSDDFKDFISAMGMLGGDERRKLIETIEQVRLQVQ